MLLTIIFSYATGETITYWCKYEFIYIVVVDEKE